MTNPNECIVEALRKAFDEYNARVFARLQKEGPNVVTEIVIPTIRCEICEKYKMPRKHFSEKRDAHLVTRWFYPKMVTCECCNDIIEKGEKIDPFKTEEMENGLD